MHPQLPKYVLFVENLYKMVAADAHNDHRESACYPAAYRTEATIAGQN